jgi:hypothetical protein
MDEIAIFEMLSPSRLVPPSGVFAFLDLVREHFLLFLPLLFQSLEIVFDAIELDLLRLGKSFSDVCSFPSCLIGCLDDKPLLLA